MEKQLVEKAKAKFSESTIHFLLTKKNFFK